MIKLDDLLNEVKKPPQALDLAHTEINSKEDFMAALSKIPEYKIRPEQISLEEVIGEGEGGWRGKSSDTYAGNYTNPLPPTMRGINMPEFYQDLGSTCANGYRHKKKKRKTKEWQDAEVPQSKKTRHPLKPKTWPHQNHPYVELGRAQLERIKDQQNSKANNRTGKATSGRGSVAEVRIPTCRLCGEELCVGVCDDYLYDHYIRTQPEKKPSQAAGSEGEEEGGDKEKKKKRKKKRKKKKPQESQGRENSGDEADNEEE